MSQLTFTWAPRASYAPEDFIVAKANEQAARFIESWPEDNTSSAALISGPEACGKTHLAMKWGARTGAVFIARARLGLGDSAKLWQGKRHAVLEDIDRLTDETALFHLLRHAEAHGVFLLLTSRDAPRALSFTLADLTSRLLALPAYAIEAPDESLFNAFLFKCFSDRQLRIGDEVVEYLARRIERSFPAGLSAVSAIEQRALESRKPVTLPFIRSLGL